MRALIGNSLLPKLKPEVAAYDVWDTKLTGFILRVLPTGNIVYRCEYARGKRVTIGRSPAITPMQARDRAREILSAKVLGIAPQSKKFNEQMTFREFIDREYGSWRIANRKNGKNDIFRLKANFIASIGSSPLSEITPIVIEKWRTARINAGTKTATVNRDIVTLKSALAKAVEWEVLKEHPLRLLKLHKVDSNAKVRYLTKDEEKRLKDALEYRDRANKEARRRGNAWREKRMVDLYPDLSCVAYADHLTPMVLISLNTGLRRGELFNLLWSDIDFERKLLTISGDIAKSGKTRHIPLNSIALSVLREWGSQSNRLNDFVFANSKTGLRFDNATKSWKGVLTQAGIENFRWHDMRHHFASKLVMHSIDLNTVRELLGHADIKMTLRYAHLAPEHKANAVAMLVING